MTPSPPIKLALVVHGRFHAFDLARALVAQKVDVQLLTNYPARIAAQFGVPRERVTNCVSHGVVSRICHLLGADRAEEVLHRWFSRWASRALDYSTITVIHSFSGVSEELFKSVGPGSLRSLVRGSAHIRTQARLLEEEERRSGKQLDKPSGWMIDREMREYELADLIIVCSSFARKSFEDEGVSADKLYVLLLGTELERFYPKTELVTERCRRILNGEPLRVLTVGTFSYRKGAMDLVDIARRAGDRFRFTFVGDTPSETRDLRRDSPTNLTFEPRRPQFDLPQVYGDADVFMFPTIEDGFAVVLSQAQASGLPLLATANCGAPDLVRENETGWILPIRHPEAFLNRLRWCDTHRAALARMVSDIHRQAVPRDWSRTALDLMKIYRDRMATTLPTAH